ncbi:MAG TPA: hypothetical protein VK361_07465 [Rubrobacteraceae bacterium]|nr:hypothetical protein [Rubrobacteraceae bacterium]
MAKEGVAIDWQKMLPPKGFVLLPHQWVIKCSFAWASRFWQLAKDYERLPQTVAGL